MSKDPILFAGGDSNLYQYTGTVGIVPPAIETNLYGYAFSDPVNFIDPDGKFAILPWALRGAYLIGIAYIGYQYETDPLFRLRVQTLPDVIKNLILPPEQLPPKTAATYPKRNVACEHGGARVEGQ